MFYGVITKTVLTFIYVQSVLADVWYDARFIDDIEPCPNFKNKVVLAEGLKISKEGNENQDEVTCSLSGDLVFNEPIDDDYTVHLIVFKSTELGDELFFESGVKLCKSLKDENTPWYPLMKLMNVTKCPIEVGKYSINDFKLSVDSASDFLNRNACGEYSVKLCLVKGLADKVSCHMIQIAIVEYQ